MTTPLATTARVKQRVILAAVQLLQRAGCDVTTERPSENRVILTVTIPPDNSDMHGLRLKNAQTT